MAGDGDTNPDEAAPLRLPPHLSATAGFFMGAADSVPGVSGGTIALIVGVYDRLITSLSRITRFPALLKDAEGRRRLREAGAFLLPLGVGLVVAYWLGTRLLVGPPDRPGLLLEPETAPICFGFFSGLVLASLREPWRHVHPVRPVHVGLLVAAAVGAWVFIGLPHAQGSPPTWAYLYGGALAITMMLLPGVSGSLLLLVLGQYQPLLRAVHGLELGTVGVALLGVGLGLIGFVPLLRHLLRRHRAATMAALTGLMIGSLRALWPWKSNYDPKDGPLTNVGIGDGVPLVLLAAALGALAAFGLSRLERRMNRPDDAR